MRRFPDLAAALLLSKGSLLAGAVGLGAVLVPILLNSCQNVQPEETRPVESESNGAGAATESSTTEASAGTTDSSPSTTDTGLRGTAANPSLVGVAGTAGAEPSGPPTPISAETRRTARGLPEAFWGYPSWSALEDPGGLVVPQTSDGECRAYIDLPLRAEATIGEPLELPLERGTMIVIESKRSTDGFIRTIDTLTLGALGWESRRFVRKRPTDSFEEEPASEHPEDAAYGKLLDSIAAGRASLILGE